MRASIKFAESGGFEVIVGPRDVDLLREQVSGIRHDSRAGVWRGPAKWSICLQLRGIFGEELDVDPAVYEWAKGAIEREQFIAALKTGAYRDNLRAFPWALDLLEFQLDSVPQMSEVGTVINADEMGAGKTVQTARAIQRSFELGYNPFPVLVVSTNSMQDTWAEELAKWCPSAEPVVVRGTPAKRRKLIEGAREWARHGDETGGHALVVTWGSLRTHTRLAGYGNTTLKRCIECDAQVGDPALKATSCETHLREFNGGWLRTVVADEAHKALNPSAKQTRALWAVTHEAFFRWPLTGTPVRNSPEDLWSLLHLIDPLAWSSKTKFIERYTVSYVGQWGLQVFGYDMANKAELDRLIEPYFICRPKSVIQPYLPPVLPSHRWCHMEPKQEKAYNAMADDGIVALDEGILTGTDKLTVQTRLRQLALATPVLEADEEGRMQVVALVEPSCKLDAFVELLEEMGDDPVVAFTDSKLFLDLVAEKLDKLKVPFVTVAGDVDNATRKLNIDRFQAGEVRVILVSLGAGAEGITLTRADTAVFLNRSWNMVANRQAEARIHRHGQVAETVKIIDLVTKDTIEEAVFETAQDKEEVLQQLIKDPAWVRRALKGDGSTAA